MEATIKIKDAEGMLRMAGGVTFDEPDEEWPMANREGRVKRAFQTTSNGVEESPVAKSDRECKEVVDGGFGREAEMSKGAYDADIAKDVFCYVLRVEERFGATDMVFSFDEADDSILGYGHRRHDEGLVRRTYFVGG